MFFNTPILFGQPGVTGEFKSRVERLIKDVLIPGGIKDERVLRAVSMTPRHEFVPASQVEKAYLDMALPIGDRQTISSPYIVSVMTEALKTDPADKVLEIGTGSGYQAAILSPLVKDVYSIEIVKPLGEQAAKVLNRLGYTNVHTRIGDGFLGWPEAAPFDKIIVTCSPEKVPLPLQEQLIEGGVLIIPVGERYQQTLYLMRKVNGKLEQEALRPTLFVPMTGTAEDNREVLADPSKPVVVNGDFEAELLNDEHVPGWYYQFALKVKTADDAPAGKQYVEFDIDQPSKPAMLMQGLPFDGRRIRKFKLSAWVSTTGAKAGPDQDEKPAVAIAYLDEKRNRIGYNHLGPFLGTKKWHRVEKEFEVPPNAREALLSVGMFGGTGIARFDGVGLEVTKLKAEPGGKKSAEKDSAPKGEGKDD